VKWKMTKEISSYFKYEINIMWILLAIKDVKVNMDGKEVKMQNGTLEINFDATLIKDHQSRWKDGFMKSLRETYDNFIIPTTIEDYEVDLFEKVNELIAVVKTYLALEGQHQY
jgi:cell division ATPase FtsA